jgi:hypothetical protein
MDLAEVDKLITERNKARELKAKKYTADDILAGPIMELLALSQPEMDWFKTLLYDHLDSEQLKKTFVNEFWVLLADENENGFRYQLIEAIRDRNEATVKTLLKSRFIEFLNSRYFKNEPV